jgi:hypothetical protein
MLIGRRQTIFKLTDRGVDLPRDLGGITSPLGLLDTVEQE